MKSPTAARNRWPDPTAVTGALSGVLFVGALAGAMRLAKGPFPRPGTDPAAVRSYYTDSARAARFSAAGQLLSALSLAGFTASVAKAARTHRRRPRAMPAAALTHTALTLPSQRTDQDVARTAERVFNLGGPIHGVCYGLFTAVLTETGRDLGLLRRPTIIAGAVSAAAGLLTPTYYRWDDAGWLIPIGRFSGYTLSAILGIRLARAT
jgi:hypothetical protein